MNIEKYSDRYIYTISLINGDPMLLEIGTVQNHHWWRKKTRQQFIWESNPIFLLLIKSNLTLQNWMAKSPYTNTHPPLWIRLWSCKSIHFTCLSIITTLRVIFRNTRDRSIRRYMITTHAYWWKTFHFVRVDRDTGIYPPVDY